MTIETLKDDLNELAREGATNPDVRVQTISCVLHTLLGAILEHNERGLANVTAQFSENRVRRLSANRN